MIKPPNITLKSISTKKGSERIKKQHDKYVKILLEEERKKPDYNGMISLDTVCKSFLPIFKLHIEQSIKQAKKEGKTKIYL